MKRFHKDTFRTIPQYSVIFDPCVHIADILQGKKALYYIGIPDLQQGDISVLPDNLTNIGVFCQYVQNADEYL